MDKNWLERAKWDAQWVQNNLSKEKEVLKGLLAELEAVQSHILEQVVLSEDG